MRLKRGYGQACLLLLVFTLAIPLTSLAQKPLIFKGIVYDADTDEPVPYASVGVPGQGVGTSTNPDGTFTLRLTSISERDSMVITCLSYDRLSVEVISMNLDLLNEFRLAPGSLVLEEVTVEEKRLTAEELIKEAVKASRRVYNQRPYLMEARYTELLGSAHAPQGYTDAWGYLYLERYAKSLQGKDAGQTLDLAQWKQIRRNQYTVEELGDDNFKYLRINRILQVKDYLLKMGPLCKRALRLYSYEIDRYDEFDGRMVYVIRFKSLSEGGGTGTLKLMADDFAMIELDFHDQAPQMDKEGLGSWSRAVQDLHYSIRYTSLEDRYYLNLMLLSYTPREAKESPVYLHLSGSNYSVKNVPELNYDQRLVLYSEMLNPLVLYSADFWERAGQSVAEVEMDMELQQYEDAFAGWDQRRLVDLPDGFGSYEELYHNRSMMELFLRSF